MLRLDSSEAGKPNLSNLTTLAWLYESPWIAAHHWPRSFAHFKLGAHF
jgi:hypothetical protein